MALHECEKCGKKFLYASLLRHHIEDGECGV